MSTPSRTSVSLDTTEVRRVCGDAWREVLDVKDVEDSDDFFVTCGGNSLLAIRMVMRVRERLGVDVPLEVFFEMTTFAGLVAATEEEAARTR